MEGLNLEEFDYMGLFILRNVKGIEDLVQFVSSEVYLSRNYVEFISKSFLQRVSKKNFNAK